MFAPEAHAALISWEPCEEVLGKKKTQHKEWISANTIHKLETRREMKTVLNNSRTRAAKARAQEEYTAVGREVKRSIKKDKRDYIDDLARQAETAAELGNMRDLCLVTKKLTGKFQQSDKPVMDKNGNPLTTTNEQLKRWAEHFRELLNHPTPDSPPDIPPAEAELPISCGKALEAEIKKAIMTLRSEKAAEPDEIPAEAIKTDIEIETQQQVDAIQPLQQDLGEGGTGPVEKRNHHQAAKKETLGTAATIEGSCSCQRQARFSTGEDEGGCRPQVPRPAGRLPAEQILCRPDRQPAHHCRTVTGVELPQLHQLHRL